jgi:ribonuclease T1
MLSKKLSLIFVAIVLLFLGQHFNPQRAVAINVLSIGQLPPQAQKVWQAIQTNGPFAYPKKDGEVFGNFEQKLPAKPRGFYRSYTVPTFGLNHRGPKRLVAGGRSKTKPEVLYYTDNHYHSFVMVNF